MRTPGVVAPPPLIFVAAFSLGMLLQRAWPLDLTISPAVRLAGIGLTVAGIALSGIVWHSFRRAGTPVSPLRAPRRLVVSGPYRYSRNPDYTGQALLFAGIALIVNSGWLLMALVPALLLVRYGVIAREERFLRQQFGSDYETYSRRVRRWL